MVHGKVIAKRAGVHGAHVRAIHAVIARSKATKQSSTAVRLI
jgi:hypothetical protein